MSERVIDSAIRVVGASVFILMSLFTGALVTCGIADGVVHGSDWIPVVGIGGVCVFSIVMAVHCLCEEF